MWANADKKKREKNSEHCIVAARKANKRNGLHNASCNFQDHSFSLIPYCIVCGYPWKCYEWADFIVSNSAVDI